MDKKVSVYSTLNDEQKAVTIPYYVHEGETTRLERINKRLWIFLLVILFALVGTNAGWIIYESQFETVSVSQEVDTGEGTAYVSGTGDINYGENKTNNQNPQEEGGGQQNMPNM